MFAQNENFATAIKTNLQLPPQTTQLKGFLFIKINGYY